MPSVISTIPTRPAKKPNAIAVLTEWDEFTTYDWQKIYDGMQKPAFVFDGRNILDSKALKAIGFVYQAIGSWGELGWKLSVVGYQSSVDCFEATLL